MLGCVPVTNDRDKAKFRYSSEYMRSNIGTARVVTEVLGEQFFAPARSRKARPDGHLRNREPRLSDICSYSGAQKGLRQK